MKIFWVERLGKKFFHEKDLYDIQSLHCIKYIKIKSCCIVTTVGGIRNLFSCTSSWETVVLWVTFMIGRCSPNNYFSKNMSVNWFWAKSHKTFLEWGVFPWVCRVTGNTNFFFSALQRPSASCNLFETYNGLSSIQV